MARLNSRFPKAYFAGATVLASTLLFTAGCGCTSCNLRPDAVQDGPGTPTLEDMLGEYVLTGRAEATAGCESGSPAEATGVLRLLGDDSEENSAALTYVVCDGADGQGCVEEDGLDRRFVWDADAGIGRYELGAASLDPTHRLERYCVMELREGRVEAVEGGVKITHRVYRGQAALEGDEACSAQFVVERRAGLECVTMHELVGVRGK